jgi:hypothetical protein
VFFAELQASTIRLYDSGRKAVLSMKWHVERKKTITEDEKTLEFGVNANFSGEELFVALRIGIIVLFAILSFSLMGCSRQVAEIQSAEPPSSFSAGESAETPDEESTETAEPEETAAKETEQSTAVQATGDADTQNQPSGVQSGNGGTSTPPQTVTPQPSTPTEPPKTADPPANPTPPVEPPKPKTAYDAPYDIARITQDARAYGESIGMTWSAPLTKDNCSWEAPIQTSSVLQGERLKTAIESGIRRVKKLQADNEYQPGEFHFQLYLEPAGGEYTIYFLMG